MLNHRINGGGRSIKRRISAAHEHYEVFEADKRHLSSQYEKMKQRAKHDGGWEDAEQDERRHGAAAAAGAPARRARRARPCERRQI